MKIIKENNFKVIFEKPYNNLLNSILNEKKRFIEKKKRRVCIVRSPIFIVIVVSVTMTM